MHTATILSHSRPSSLQRKESWTRIECPPKPPSQANYSGVNCPQSYVAEDDETEQDETEQDETEQDETEQDETEQDETEQDETEQDETEQDDTE